MSNTTTTRTWTTRATLAALAVAAVLVVPGCGGHDGAGGAAGSTGSGAVGAVVDRGGSQPSVPGSGGGAAEVDPAVHAMWEKTLEICPVLASIPTSPPDERYDLGVAALWPGDAEVSRMLSGAQADGADTPSLLVDLRVALSSVRQQLANAVGTGDAALDRVKAGGGSPDAVQAGFRSSVEDIHRGWEVGGDYIAGELATGQRTPPTGLAAQALAPLDTTRARSCTE